ncbi:hypothetical protein SAMN02910291_02175 [Desulfovibrio desulfuricans]|uniref:Uncharacterized protein n=2 Tax=Desulfovibrio desulfuricans TaxID=876 RepID=A0AA94HU41_DESDE|nr:hypothetical protein SAMN02910291_02175 [Desulfovibrio desulfuricans]SPD35342.1 Hypothetical protein DSVG11_1239 [Desulfovibrio sp. G11]
MHPALRNMSSIRFHSRLRKMPEPEKRYDAGSFAEKAVKRHPRCRSMTQTSADRPERYGRLKQQWIRPERPQRATSQQAARLHCTGSGYKRQDATSGRSPQLLIFPGPAPAHLQGVPRNRRFIDGPSVPCRRITAGFSPYQAGKTNASKQNRSTPGARQHPLGSPALRQRFSRYSKRSQP